MKLLKSNFKCNFSTLWSRQPRFQSPPLYFIVYCKTQTNKIKTIYMAESTPCYLNQLILLFTEIHSLLIPPWPLPLSSILITALCDGPLGHFKKPSSYPMSLWAQLGKATHWQSGSLLGNILHTGTVHSQVSSAELKCTRMSFLYSTTTKTHFWLTVNGAGVVFLQPSKQHSSAANNRVLVIKLRTIYTQTYIHWNTQSEAANFLSKWHTGRAPVCFTGRSAPESLASRLDAPVERWICQRNHIAHPSEEGSRSDLPFITSLTLLTYGQKHIRHSGPVVRALIQNSNSKTHCFPAGLLSTVHYSQIGYRQDVVVADSKQKTSLQIRGDLRNRERSRGDRV